MQQSSTIRSAGRRLGDATRLYEFSLRSMNDDHDEAANLWRDSRAASFRRGYVDPQFELARDAVADLKAQQTAYAATLQDTLSAENEHNAGLADLSETEIVLERALQTMSEALDLANSVLAECHGIEYAIQRIEAEICLAEYDPI